MPVKISSTQSDDPRVISLDEYEFGRENFDMHYYKDPGAEQTEFSGQDFKVPWDNFFSAVHDFYTTNSIDPENVALRFVHCFDELGNSLYLRMQICSFGTPYFNNEGYQVFPIEATPCAWYDLKESSITPSTDTTLKGQAYFDTMFYLVDPQGQDFENLDSAVNKYVENFTYPWNSEVYQLYLDNGEPTGADIHFASCSYTATPQQANVVWPHGNVLYLSEGTHVFLDNDDYMVIFSNKGADSGTLCPPDCGVYINPVLPQ